MLGNIAVLCYLCITYLILFGLFQVKEFLGRFATIPDIIELDHLTVSGDVRFGKKVTLKVIFRKRWNFPDKE